jgi:hypothetical protein
MGKYWRFFMALLSMFYGIVICMFPYDNKKYHLPHIHVRYQGKYASISIADGKILEGKLKPEKYDLVKGLDNDPP